MQDFADRDLEEVAVQSYAIAYAHHGDLGLGFEPFLSHLYSITEKRLGANAPASASTGFINSLHLNDLYLTLACAQGSELAWRRFVSTYGECISRVCRCVCPSGDAARDLAGSLPGQLFLPGATGRSRIASYKGLSPLAAWLAVVVKRLAEKKRQLKSNNLESIDRMPDLADETSLLKIEAALRACKYRLPVRDSLQLALSLLSDRERTILCLRYEQQLQVSHIARLFGVKPHAITQQIGRSSQKLRQQIISTLAIRHKLCPAAIEECVADLLNDSDHSFLS